MFRVYGLGFRVQGLGFGIESLGEMAAPAASSASCRVKDPGSRLDLCEPGGYAAAFGNPV